MVLCRLTDISEVNFCNQMIHALTSILQPGLGSFVSPA